MNIKLITKAMHTLSLLSEDDVQMVMKLRGLSEDERQMLMLVLEPGVKPSKKSSKKSAGKGGAGKSKREVSLREQIGSVVQGSGNNLQPAVADDASDSTNTRCQFTRSDGKLCFLLSDHNIHHMKTANEYHEFQPAEQAAVASGD